MSDVNLMAEKVAECSHTPGPWQFYADTPSVDPNWHIVTNASRMRVLANVHIEPGNAMDLANACLIAAAPELLAKLHDVAAECSECAGTGKSFRYKNGERYEISCRDCDDIRKVIAKAEGRS